MGELIWRHGRFGATQVPSGLPPGGLLPSGWDGADRPTEDYQCIVGEEWIFDPDTVTDPLSNHVYRYTGSGWVDLAAPPAAAAVALVQQLASAGLTLNATATVVPGISITVTVTAGQAVIADWVADLFCSAYTGRSDVVVVLWRDGAAIAGAPAAIYVASATPARATITQRFVDRPAAGTHTYTLRASAPTGATYLLGATHTTLTVQTL